MSTHPFTSREAELIALAHETGREYERHLIETAADQVLGLPTLLPNGYKPPEVVRAADLGGGYERTEQNPADPPTFLATLHALLLDSAGLDSIPTPEPIVTGILYLNSLAWLIGSPGHAKSFAALDIAACVATGQPWQTHPTIAGPVLYLIAEGTSGLRQRVRAWEASNNRKMLGVHFLPVAVQAGVPGHWSALCELAQTLGPRLIVIDTQARTTVGLEENSAKDMGLFVANVDQLRRASGACVAVVHHQGRNGEHMRGSTALEGAATTIIRLTKDDDLITVSCTKQKDAAPFDDITLRLVPYGESAILTLTDNRRRSASGASPNAMKMAQAWWNSAGEHWVSASKLVDVIAPKTSFYRYARELELCGKVQVNRGGRYPQYCLVPRWDGS